MLFWSVAQCVHTNIMHVDSAVKRSVLSILQLMRSQAHLNLKISHFGCRSYDGSTHHGGKDVIGEVGASKTTLDELRQ